MSALTAADLELESVELLPSRETLSKGPKGPGNLTAIWSSNSQGNYGGVLNGNNVSVGSGNAVGGVSLGGDASNTGGGQQYGGTYQSNSNVIRVR